MHGREGHQQAAVGIVGAGLAGLSAARALAAAGVRVEAFDKGRGPGGRASTRRVELGDAVLRFDHGAQYFTVRDDRFARIVEHWSAQGACAPWIGQVAAVDSPGCIVPKAESPWRYVGTPGMNAIVSALLTDLPDDARVRFSTTVRSLEHAEAGWAIHADDGELGRFDALLVATPAPQAAGLLKPLPKLAEHAGTALMQPCWAVMAAFEEPLPIEADGLFVNLENQPLSWIARDSSKPERSAGERWVLHAGPMWSEAHIEDDREAVAEALLAAMAQATGATIPRPIHDAAHRWRYALTTSRAEGGFLLDARSRVAVAGDWCHGGRVEGAVLSGLRAADALLTLLHV
jgi:predicted NAD/FAD-dependent oxidoreductase